MAAEYTGLLLKGGKVIDPANNFNGTADVYIKNGLIKAVGKNLPVTVSDVVIDISGLLVTPGLVDIHTHLFASTGVPGSWAGDWSVYPDSFSFRSGTTTMVDAGSAGWKNFDHFRATIIERSKTRVLSFLNIVSVGMLTEETEQAHSCYQVAEAVKAAEKHSDIIVGIKTAHYQPPDWFAVDTAVEAGNQANLPVMVDFGYFRTERPYWELVENRLRPGDISTHCFRGPVPVINKSGRVFDYIFRAHDKGVLFDLGHGCGSFLFRNAVPAIKGGYPLDSISTDLHVLSMNTHMIDMPTTMSKMLAAGLSLEDVIRKSTCSPAKIVGHPELGTLTVGGAADIAVWNLESGEFGFSDISNGYLAGSERFRCEMTIKDGEVLWDWNSRSSLNFTETGELSGVREGLEFLIFPEE